LYKNINSILERNVDPHYYLGSGYLETLKRHRKREVKKGNNFGFKIINEPDNKNPIANTLLASGGSGRERNLIYDPQKGIAGKILKNKKTPLNNEGIRIMTPTEWGKLQGFVSYAFLKNGKDIFGFPKEVSELHQYKQFGNSVTVPVIETMAVFIVHCLKLMNYMSPKSGQ
jgi:DNA (cytosine-5)-methyltransferase 1